MDLTSWIFKNYRRQSWDFYIRPATDTKLNLITRKNFKEYFTRLFISNDSLVLKIKKRNTWLQSNKRGVELYNTN